MRYQPGPPRAYLPHQLCRDTGGQYVGLYLFLSGQCLHARRPNPMAANHLFHQPLIGQPVETATITVADAKRVNDAQTSWRTGREKALLYCSQQGVGLH